MSETPGKWVMLNVTIDGVNQRNIFGTSYGGYAGSDSWRLSSPIVTVEKEYNFYIFITKSGNKYYCHENNYGVAGAYNQYILDNFMSNSKHDIEILDSETIFI